MNILLIILFTLVIVSIFIFFLIYVQMKSEGERDWLMRIDKNKE